MAPRGSKRKGSSAETPATQAKQRRTATSSRNQRPSPEPSTSIEETTRRPTSRRGSQASDNRFAASDPASPRPTPSSTTASRAAERDGAFSTTVEVPGHEVRANVDRPANSVREIQYGENLAATDPITRLAATIEALAAARGLASETESRVNNSKFTKKLPEFDGNPLEWLNFKEIYDESSRLHGFTDRQNITRLVSALKGEAREAVSTLVATTRDAGAIIETLESQFGNKGVIAQTIMNGLYALPRLESNSGNITTFAPKVHNAVLAFKSLKLIGYLHNPDLRKNILEKLPSALRFSYNEFAAGIDTDESDLEKLAKFLRRQETFAIKAGCVELNTLLPPNTRNKSNKVDRPREIRRGAVYTNISAPGIAGPSGVSGSDRSQRSCLFCKRVGHNLENCRAFSKETPGRRGYFATLERLCYKCLKTGHGKDACRCADCAICQRPHHPLLHRGREFNRADSQISERRNSEKVNNPADGNQNKGA